MASATSRNVSKQSKDLTPFGTPRIPKPTGQVTMEVPPLEADTTNTSTSEVGGMTSTPTSEVGGITNNVDNLVGLVGQQAGARAEAKGPRRGGAMNTINRNIQTPFAMKETPFSLTEKQENIDVNNDGKISGTDLNELRK
jgi:hypothetical protein